MEELNAFLGAPAGTNHPEHILTLTSAFKTAIVNPKWVKDQKKAEKAMIAFALPDPEARVRAQLETNALKTLRAKAAKRAEETGTYTAPTQSEIATYIEDGLKVWRDKQR
jgi:hypothetical protein